MSPKLNTHAPMKRTDDIAVTMYEKERHADFFEASHYLPLHNYFKPDAVGRLKEFVHRALFLNQDEITLIAYSVKYKKAVGSITARKITERLWGAWNIFVLPEYRGRRIASLLLKETVHHLKRKKVEKLVSHVAKNNISCIRHSRGSGWNPLCNRLFKCERIGPIAEHNFKGITVRELRHGEKKQLFDIFELCVGKQWCSYLEMNPENFLDRIYGPALWEQYGLLSKVAIRKDIKVAESGGELRGYAISRAIRLTKIDYVTHLFVPIYKDFEKICKSLLLKGSQPRSHRAQNKFSFAYVGDNESHEHIHKFGFETEEFLVQSLQL